MLKESHFFFFSIRDYSKINLHYTCPGVELAVRG